MSLALIALALAAQGQPSHYRAIGTEPFWSLTMDRRMIRYQPADGRAITVARPRAVASVNGEWYPTRTLTVAIAHKPCSDGMSDRTYRDSVTVRIGNAVRTGCGGPILNDAASATLLEGKWLVAAMDGKPAVRGTVATISFTGSRLQGSTGCNTFRAGFEFGRGHLQARPLATTRRGCVGNGVATQGRRLLALLGQRLSVTRNSAGKLVMTAPDRRTLTLTPSP